MSDNPISVFVSKFWDRVEMTDGCWIHQGTPKPDGYIQVRDQGRPKRYAHCIAYEKVMGAIPEGLELDHLCRNPRCVRPTHLEPVTHQENIRRGFTGQYLHSLHSHCRQGHALVAENTYVSPQGARQCKICLKRRGYDNYRKKKAATTK